MHDVIDPTKKRHNSMLIPYYIVEDVLSVFLQRRTADAPRNPLMLGGFGGGLEDNENNEEALLREMQEELEYVPQNYSLLGVFETEHSVSNYYIEEVSPDFDKPISFHEGTGEWHKASEVVERDDISPNTRKVILTLFEKLIIKKLSQ